MARASHKGMGRKLGVEHVGETPPDTFDRDDIASEIQGRNNLKGNDQARVRNERRTLPDEKRETESLIESFENLDPATRARR
jgi:hypothetical protein